MNKLESSSRKLADIFVAGITGKKSSSIKFLDAHDKWIETIPGYMDISIGTRSFHKTIFSRFSEWCISSGYQFIEQIDNAAALKYAKVLWESGISGKTYNDHISHLSRFFAGLDTISRLPFKNPFDNKRIVRKKQAEIQTASHQPLEPHVLVKVIEEATLHGKEYRDLFIVGSQTGMRLKDAALLQWDFVADGFISITPHKTMKSGNTARIPISPVLNDFLMRRKAESRQSIYVIPEIAEHYLYNNYYVTKKCKTIFENVLGKEVTRAPAGKHRKNNTAIYSFHSFRTTFMSLLASKDVAIRDAMRVMGWESVEMIRIYERELEKSRKNADERTLKIVRGIEEFGITVPDCTIKKKLVPAKDALASLIIKYSNIAIGQIYGISETAVRKWLGKFGITRKERIESPSLTDDEISAVRKTLKDMA